MRACVRAHACVRACVRACERVCGCVGVWVCVCTCVNGVTFLLMVMLLMSSKLSYLCFVRSIVTMSVLVTGECDGDTPVNRNT